MLEGYKQLLYFHFAGLFYQILVIKYMYIIYYIIHGQMSQVHFSFVQIHAWFSPHCNQQKSGYIANKAFLSSRSKCLCHVISIWLLLFLCRSSDATEKWESEPQVVCEFFGNAGEVLAEEAQRLVEENASPRDSEAVDRALVVIEASVYFSGGLAVHIKQHEVSIERTNEQTSKQTNQ